MATLADLRARVEDYLYAANPNESPFVTQIAASYTPSGTSITVLDDTQWEVNDIGENPTTGEQWLVLAKPGSNVLTVSRGWKGTAAASTGSDDLIYKNPRFGQAQIDQQIQNTIDDLSHWDIHVFAQGTVTRADPKTFYEVTEGDVMDPYGVLSVYYVEDQTERPVPIPFRYYQRLGTGPTEYTGEGEGIHILDWGDVADTEDAHFIYAQVIQNPSTLLTRQEDLVCVGAVARLLGQTITPATHDPGGRTDRTVQPGQTGRDSRYFVALFTQQARMESAELFLERNKLMQTSVRQKRAQRWRP